MFQLDGHFFVDSDPHCGGLMMLWKEPYDVKIQSFSAGYIYCIVKYGSYHWMFTGFYGNLVVSLRIHSWNLLIRLADIHELKSLPCWLEEILMRFYFNSEKCGGMNRADSQISGFADAFEECGLEMNRLWEILSHGAIDAKEMTLYFARLDRFVCNFEWNLLHPDLKSENRDFYDSDHILVSLLPQTNQAAAMKRFPKRFTFENKWLLEEDFSEYLAQGWTDNMVNQSLPAKLSHCSRDLISWAGSRFDGLGRRIKDLRKKLNHLMS